MIVTWIAIFPLVALSQWALGPLMQGWPTLLSTAVSIAAVVCVAVPFVLPFLFKQVGKIMRKRAARAANTNTAA